MPALLTEEEFRELFNVNAGVPVALYVRQARSQVARVVGAEVVADAEEEQPADTTRADALRLAAVYFGIFYAYPVVNNRITLDGVVKSAREEGAGGGVVLAYLTPKEVRQGAEHFRERAYELLAPYAAGASQADAVRKDDYPRSISATGRTIIR